MIIKFLCFSFLILPFVGCINQENMISEVQKSQFVSNDRLREIRDNCELPLGLIQLVEYDKTIVSYRRGQLGVILYLADPSYLTSDIVKEPRFIADSLFVPGCYLGSDLQPIVDAIKNLNNVEDFTYPVIDSVDHVTILFRAEGFTFRDYLDGISLEVKDGKICDGGRFYTPSQH